MCLDEIREMNPFKFGYKVFEISFNGELHSLYEGNKKPIPQGKWIRATLWSNRPRRKIRMGYVQYYPQGWHIFEKQDVAKAWQCFMPSRKIFKVQCRDMHTVGRQVGDKVGVCLWIKILKEAT